MGLFNNWPQQMGQMKMIQPGFQMPQGLQRPMQQQQAIGSGELFDAFRPANFLNRGGHGQGDPRQRRDFGWKMPKMPHQLPSPQQFAGRTSIWEGL